MTSHEYARKLQQAAEFLLSRPAFETSGNPILYSSYWSDKARFLAAVKALGAGKKEYKDNELLFSVPVADGLRFTVDIMRNAVCRKVQEEKWECEPLLTADEEAQITA